jgi:hypothetical protein
MLNKNAAIFERELKELHKGKKPKLSFNKILLAAIDEALALLGESVKTSVYSSLEETYNIKKREIPLKINDFSSALEKIFGLGARTLEILFMKNLHAKVGVTCKWPAYEWPLCKWILPEMTFPEYVSLMKRNFEEAYKEEEMGVLIEAYREIEEERT